MPEDPSEYKKIKVSVKCNNHCKVCESKNCYEKSLEQIKKEFQVIKQRGYCGVILPCNTDIRKDFLEILNAARSTGLKVVLETNGRMFYYPGLAMQIRDFVDGIIMIREKDVLPDLARQSSAGEMNLKKAGLDLIVKYMDELPFVSVIISTCNNREKLNLVVKALLKQDYEKFEIIIADNGSDDGTSEMVKAWDNMQIKYYHQKGNHARNLGCMNARGSYFILIDANIIAMPGFIRNHVNSLRNYDAVIGYNASYFNSKQYSFQEIRDYLDSNSEIRILNDFRHHLFAKSLTSETCPDIWKYLVINNISIKREVFENEKISDNFTEQSVVDLEYGYRLYTNGFSIKMDDSCLALHMAHENIQTKKKIDTLLKNFKALFKLHPHRIILDYIISRFDTLPEFQKLNESLKLPRRPPLASVIIPTYNHKSVLKLVLESLLRQTYQNFEVIIADDGSNDGTEDMVNEFKNKINLKFIRQERNGFRLAAARNLGASIAKGRYFIFIDNDVIVRTDFIENHVKALEKYDCIVTYIHDFKSENNSHMNLENYAYCEKLFYSHLYKDIRFRIFNNCMRNDSYYNPRIWESFMGHSFSVKADIFKDFKFNESFREWGAEDHEYSYRLVSNGKRMKFMRTCAGIHYPHQYEKLIGCFSEKKVNTLLKNMLLFYRLHPHENVEEFLEYHYYVHIPKRFRNKQNETYLFSGLEQIKKSNQF